MADIWKLVKLDARMLKPYSLYIFLFLPFFFVIAWAMKSAMIFSFFTMYLMITTANQPFTVADKYGLDILFGTLPVTRRDMVKGRYAFPLAIWLGMVTINLLLSFALAALLGEPLRFWDVVSLQVITLCIMLLLVSIQYPIFYRLGFAKGKLAATVPIFIVLFLPSLLSRFLNNTNVRQALQSLDLSGMSVRYDLIAAAVILVLYAVSYALSQRWYALRDER